MSLQEFYKDKVILVTGGCGSIGRSIVDQVLGFEPREVRVYDSSEQSLFQMERRHGNVLRIHGPVAPNRQGQPVLRLVNGDVRDKEQLRFSLQGVHVVFHAAALKHVPNCEYNPFEAIKTNVLGTQNVIEVANEKGVERVVCISSDKAINPVNTLGASKLLMEKLALSVMLENLTTRYACVRFGNVLDSDGSVIPIWRSQIQRGEAVTVTHPEMKRFFMSIKDAVRLVLDAGAKMEGREVFVLKMKAMKILDLAEVLTQELAPIYGYKAEDIPVKIIGTRPGERLNESLLTDEEVAFTQEVGDMYVFRPQVFAPHLIESKREPQIKISALSTASVEMLSRSEIRELLHSNEMLETKDRRKGRRRG